MRWPFESSIPVPRVTIEQLQELKDKYEVLLKAHTGMMENITALKEETEDLSKFGHDEYESMVKESTFLKRDNIRLRIRVRELESELQERDDGV